MDSSSPSPVSSRRSSPRSRSASMNPAQNCQIPTFAVDANTGPKGVIADAQSFERARKRSFRKTLNGLSSALSSNVLGAAERISAGARRRSPSQNGSDKSTEDEDEFLQSWREKRLLEMEEKGRVLRTTRRTSPSKHSWPACLTSVDALGYLDAVERVPRDAVVVVLISDDESSVSREVEGYVTELARKYEFTRFIKLSCEEAEMDTAATPAILAYRSGELIANLVSIVDEIPPHLQMNASTLEAVLQRNDALR